MEVRPRRVTSVLVYIMIFLVLAHLGGQTLKYVFGHGRLFGLIELFDLNAEENIPTLFSTLLLLINGGLFLVLWKSKQNVIHNQWIWLFAAIILFYLAVDEYSEIHEKFSRPFHELFHTTGLLYYAWVIPYSFLVILFAVFFIPVWWKMQKKVRLFFAASGFLYVAGAIGMEMLGGREYEKMGDMLTYKCALLAGVEESLEMGGMILLSYTLLCLISAGDCAKSIILVTEKVSTQTAPER